MAGKYSSSLWARRLGIFSKNAVTDYFLVGIFIMGLVQATGKKKSGLIIYV